MTKHRTANKSIAASGGGHCSFGYSSLLALVRSEGILIGFCSYLQLLKQH